MSNYQTNNPVPSIDPRDLDDNATIFDRLMNETITSVPDRTGIPRKTWWQLEQDAAVLVSQNVSALAALTLAVNKGIYATGPGALATYDLTALARTFSAATDATAQQAALPWAALNNETVATLSSAATVNIGAATTPVITISGTTAITAFDTVAAGVRRQLRFVGILTLTHNATALILPGGASITTAVGDVAEFRSLGGGNWACTMYSKVSGQPNAVVAVTQGGTGVTTSTGSGNVVLSSAPTLSTPVIDSARAAVLQRAAPTTKSTSFTLAANESWIVCNGAGTITVTLPAAGAAAGIGRELMLKNIAAQTVVSATANITPQNGGAATTAILPATIGKWVTLVSDGSTWQIMQSN